MPSSPVVSLSSDTIDQVCRESVASPDLMDLWSSWQQNVESEMWPYNAVEPWLVYCVVRLSDVHNQFVLSLLAAKITTGQCLDYAA